MRAALSSRPIELIAFLSLASIASCATTSAATSDGPRLRIEDLGPDLQLLKVDDEVWIHVSDDKTDRWGTVPANGLLVSGGKETVLVDTGWKESQTARLLDFAERMMSGPVRHVVITHAHSDRMGGIRAVLKPGITIHAQDATVRAIERLGLPLNGAKIAAFTDEDVITLGPRAVELFYPGAGHAPDNSVVFLPGENILFAGCIVKSARSADLGNREDAVLASWPVSLLKLLDRYGHTKTDATPSARHADLVIPGHGPPGRVDIIHHTLGLLEQEMSSTTHDGHAKHD